MKITYLAGPITGIPDYQERFALAELDLIKKGHKVFSPAFMPEGLPHEAYMPICYAMMDACNTICFLPGWENSKGACMEHEYAMIKGTTMMFWRKQNGTVSNILSSLRATYQQNSKAVIPLLPDLFQAVENGRIVELPDENTETIQMVETALRLKLYDWQKAFILGASNYLMPGRCTGKTTAIMIKLCLTKGESINLFKAEEAKKYVDGNHGTQYETYFKSELKHIYYELARQPLVLRKIYFDEQEKRAARWAVNV